MSQKEFAALIGCAVPTVQAVELGKLTLSERLGEKISYETGVNLQWLMKGDVTAPPFTRTGHLAFTQRAFEVRRSELSRPKVETSDILHVHSSLQRALISITTLLLRAYEMDQFNLAHYKLEQALSTVLREFKAEPDFTEWTNTTFREAARQIAYETSLMVGQPGRKPPELDVSRQLEHCVELLARFQKAFLKAFNAKKLKTKKQPPRKSS
jgi:transcriptional regulator with XRE-family HTH domain